MIKLNEFMQNRIITTNTAGSIIGKLFQSRDVAHIIHLSTNSNHIHLVTNDYYDEIIDLIDRLAETYQSVYGIIDIIIPESKRVNDILSYFTSLKKDIINSKKNIFENSYMHSIIDEIIEKITTLIYKIKFLQ